MGGEKSRKIRVFEPLGGAQNVLPNRRDVSQWEQEFAYVEYRGMLIDDP